jgi:hypothetical protein
MPCKVIFSLIILFLLSACGVDTAAYYPPTPLPIGTPTQDVILFLSQAGSSQSTAQAAQATADYFSTSLTATSQAYEQQATERAWDATATADSNIATTTASAQAAIAAANATATQISLDVTSTAAFANVSAYGTAMAGQAASVELSVQRERTTNQIKAFAPWVVTLLAFLVAIVLVLRLTRFRVIPAGQAGDKPILLDIVDGTATDADLMAHATQGLERRDLRMLPAPDANTLADIKLRDQQVDLLTRGTHSSPSPRRQLPVATAPSLPRPRVQPLDPKLAFPILRDIIPAVARDAVGADIVGDDEKKE